MIVGSTHSGQPIGGGQDTLALLDGEKEGFIFTRADKHNAIRALGVLAELGASDSADAIPDTTVVHEVSERLASIVLAQDTDYDPHSALYYLNRMQELCPGVNEGHQDEFVWRAGEIELADAASKVPVDMRRAVGLPGDFVEHM